MEYNQLIPDKSYKSNNKHKILDFFNYKNIQIFFIFIILILQIISTIILIEFKLILLELKNETDNDTIYINKFKIIIDYVCKNLVQC